ncbi:uncharacterized protein LOC135399876 [Ornithodoros turicata]|uniref:uncharacterized protein LOC135399876 n=1 Tax=Ornithodoros turicata TaxID=34597 RepID=UPI00313A38AD
MATDCSLLDESANYLSSLSDADRARYEQKIAQCGVDPFSIDAKNCTSNVDLWPQIDMCDILDFLVLRTSFITRKQLKSYKSLEGHNFVTSGWVKEPWLKQPTPHTIIAVTQVNHSQALSKLPLKTWIFAKNDGEVLAAHCLCMAGNGEACSHVAALLFYLECGHRARVERSCTDGDNSWLPAHIRRIETRPVVEMDFASASMKKRRLDGDAASPCELKAVTRTRAPPPTKQEWEKFFDCLIASGLRPAVSSTDPRYSDLFVPAVRTCNGADLRRLYDPSTSSLTTYSEVLEHCDNIFKTLTINDKAIRTIEKMTRNQAKSAHWFTFRMGRVTASSLYDVCHTQLGYPSMSLIKKICSSQSDKVSTPALKHGREKEAVALAKYKKLAHELHNEVQFEVAGLFISEDYLFLGATPDLLVRCTCCGSGVVEVKCPWKVRDGHLSDLLNDSRGCVRDCNGVLELKMDHRYHYQVQAQMFVCNASYADFVLWNENEINVQRIYRDDSFMKPLVETATDFFKKVLLPEVVTHWFSSRKENTPVLPAPPVPCTSNPLMPSQTDNTKAAQCDTAISKVVCTCKGRKRSKIIACNNATCSIKLFHLSCVGLKRSPKGVQWYCESCSKQLK